MNAFNIGDVVILADGGRGRLSEFVTADVVMVNRTSNPDGTRVSEYSPRSCLLCELTYVPEWTD